MPANVTLRHESVQQATDEMVQATEKMINNLNELVDTLKRFAADFHGESARAWQEFQQAANQAATHMHADFGQGAQRLGNMHQIFADADKRGSSHF